MNTATRVRTLLALGTLGSIALWGVTIFDRISARADWTDGLAASTLTIVTGLAVCNARAIAQREKLRISMERDRDIMARALAGPVSPPRGGDGDRAQQQQERPAWVLYLKEPA